LVGLAFTVVVFVVANAVPEMIYQTHHTGLRLIAEGYHFITTNGLEWFPPTLVASAVAYALAAAVEMLGLPAALQAPVQMVAIGLLVYALALFRGLLFAELAATGSRGRVFRYRGRRR